MSAHITTDELFQYAMPPEILFAPGRSDPGTCTDPAAGGSNVGLGTVKIGRGAAGKGGSNPRDAWSVKIRVATAGEINTPGVINLAGVPTVAVSLDNGTTYGPALTPDDAGRLSHERSGLVLLLANGAAGSPVTFGSGNAALAVTPKQYGLSLEIVSGTSTAVAFDRDSGQITLTLASGTTATTAAAALNDSGLRVSAVAGGTGGGAVATATRTSLPFVSFAVGDVWTCTTAPSADATLAVEAASDAIDEAAGNTLSLPITSPGGNFKYHVAQLAVWRWRGKLGLQTRETEPKETMRWMADVADGTYRPRATETGGVSFPDRVRPPSPFDASDGGIPI